MGHWSPERREEFERRWNAGETKPQIRRAMGLTPGQVAGRITKWNLHTHPSRRAHMTWRADAPFIVEGRTKFPGRVTDRGDALKPGIYQSKLGGRVLKGKWKGMPVYALTLEERATCPTTCQLWISCYGNNMSMASRMRHGEQLERKLWRELGRLQRRHPRGFVVRLHILGDFATAGYVEFWREALDTFPALHAFGYTAWQRGTRQGDAVAKLRDRQWERFAVRTSGSASGPRTRVIETESDARAGEIICPAQTVVPKPGKRNISCSSCALCWATTRPIVFIRH